MQSLAQHLIARERRATDAADSDGHAAFRVCDKLRRPLSTFTGTNGFRALLSRALTLAKPTEPWLERVTINPDGTLFLSVELEAELDGAAAARGGAQLTTQLLLLLEVFIGEALTLRVVHDVWSKPVNRKAKPRGKKL
jgi:hypothetical protein